MAVYLVCKETTFVYEPLNNDFASTILKHVYVKEIPGKSPVQRTELTKKMCMYKIVAKLDAKFQSILT